MMSHNAVNGQRHRGRGPALAKNNEDPRARYVRELEAAAPDDAAPDDAARDESRGAR